MDGGVAEAERRIGDGRGETGAGLQGVERSRGYEGELEQTTRHRDRLCLPRSKAYTLEKGDMVYDAERLFGGTGRDEEEN